MTEKSVHEISLSPLPMPPPSSEDLRQRQRSLVFLLAGWLNTLTMAGAAAYLTWLGIPLRPRSQMPFGFMMVFIIALTAGIWCVVSWLKFPPKSISPQAMQRGGLWVMTGAVIYQAVLLLMIGRFSMVGVGGVVGMAICVAAMWVFYLRGREVVAK